VRDGWLARDASIGRRRCARSVSRGEHAGGAQQYGDN